MSFEADYRTKVKAAVSGLTSNVNWTVRPERSAWPAVVLQVVSDDRSQHMGGFNGFYATRVQIDCFATSRTGAIALRDAVLAVVDAGTVGATQFLRSFVNNVFDGGQNTSTGFVHREVVDLTVWHN